MRTDKKIDLLKRRRWRIRKKINGTETRPRMSVRMTHKNIYEQFINDESGRTIASVTSRDKAVENRAEISANVDGATQIGKLAGEVAVAAGIKSAVFDRSGTRYHGKIKALADAAREVIRPSHKHPHPLTFSSSPSRFHPHSFAHDSPSLSCSLSTHSRPQNDGPC